MRYLIAGAGPAGMAAAARLARLTTGDDEINLLESASRPAPSKVLWPEYAAGELSCDLLDLSATQTRPVNAAAASALPVAERVKIRTGCGLVGFGPETHRALLTSGDELHYDRLLLATGLPASRPAVAGSCGPGVYHLASLGAAAAMRSQTLAMAPTEPVAVVGGGAAGIRLAQALATRGHSVTLCEMRPWLLPEVLTAPLATEASRHLEDVGVMVRTGVRAVEIVRDNHGQPEYLLCESTAGQADLRIPCRVVAFCTGAQTIRRSDACARGPRGPGVDLDPGVVVLAGCGAITVDEGMRTRWPGVFAAGDVALPPGWGRPPGLWAVAHWQGGQAALTMAGHDGGPAPSDVWLTVRVGDQMLLASRPYASEVTSTGRHQWRARLMHGSELDPGGLRTADGGEGVAH